MIDMNERRSTTECVFRNVNRQTAVPLNEIMRYDKLGCQPIRVLNMVDHLRGGPDTQLERVSDHYGVMIATKDSGEDF